MLRKYSTHKIPEKFLRYYICGLSTETVVYKVGLSPVQLLSLGNKTTSRFEQKYGLKSWK